MKFEDDKSLLILDAKEEAGSKLGDNYMSVVIKTSVTGKRGNGEPYNKSFMSKIIPRHRKTAGIMRLDEMFQTETYVYTEILPVLGPFGPRIVYADDATIIMENLRDDGYRVCERRNFLDFDHCMFTVQTLARFHAKSLALKLEKFSTFEKLVGPLKELIFPESSTECAGESINGCVRVSLKYLKTIEHPTNEINDMIGFLEKNDDKFFDIVKALINSPKTGFDCIAHGDTWINNLLYKHDDKGKVIDMKFIDYQIIRYGSPSLDFLYFMYTSANPMVLEKHYDHLAEIYYDSLIRNLQALGLENIENREGFSLKSWKDELQKYSIYGFLTGFWLLHAVLAGETDVIDMDKLTEDDLKNIEEMELPVTEEKLERMKTVTLHYRKHYL